MLRTLLLLLAFLPTPAIAAVEMSLYSHELTGSATKVVDFPHTFITLKGTPDAGGRSIDRDIGFTASRISPAILVGPVKGKMVSAPKSYIRQSRRHITLRLTDVRYAAVMAAYRNWAAVKGLSYDLDTRNCVHFVAAMAKAAGLALPTGNELTKRPAAYLDAVAASNRR